MSKICKGCGIVMQSEDKTKLGYTPKPEADYCQRCFRIRHYDDVVISMKQDYHDFAKFGILINEVKTCLK